MHRMMSGSGPGTEDAGDTLAIQLIHEGILRHLTGSAFSKVLACSFFLAAVLATAEVRGFGNPAPSPATLKPDTLSAFEHYVQLTDENNARELASGAPFPWLDGVGDREAALKQIRNGQMRIVQKETKDNGNEIRCPDGLIHHWEATAFIPGVKLEDVLYILQDYDHHSIYYKPDVERSKTESHEGDKYRAFLRFKRHKVITVTLDTTHDVQYFRDSPVKAHSRSTAIRIAEVENAGKSDEREKTPGDDNGFLWKMETWWRLTEQDGGVYIQSEVVSLTRDIPTGLGWMVGPFVTSIPKESLAFTMQATQKAVQARANAGTAPTR